LIDVFTMAVKEDTSKGLLQSCCTGVETEAIQEPEFAGEGDGNSTRIYTSAVVWS
jgi:hypothetical protein